MATSASPPPEPLLSVQDQATLLAVARSSIAEALVGRESGPTPVESTGALARHAGAFVTLRTLHGELRGCIGRTAASSPMVETVRTMAVLAATRDPRFTCVTVGELAGLVIEVSVLGPLKACEPSEVTVGRDGLMIEGAGKRGLLLPQVAVERGWEREEFLSATCDKAGLPRSAWRTGARVFRFEAFHFGEDEG